MFIEDGAVCPTSLRYSIYTTGNIDNIDHNPTAKESFHGTAVSLTQHVTKSCLGEPRQNTFDLVNSSQTHGNAGIKPLLDSYSQVPPIPFDANALPCQQSVEPVASLASHIPVESFVWTQDVERLLGKERLDDGDYISWSANHASKSI